VEVSGTANIWLISCDRGELPSRHWRSAWAIRSDLRFAFRAFRREPAFTLVAVLTLAVGIGIATATFTVANGILFRSLPVREEDRVVVMWAKQRDFAPRHVLP